MENVISPKHLSWFEQRGISASNVTDMGIYSGQHRQTGDGFEVVPHPRGEVIVFPYMRHGEIRSIKYRGPGKKFYQKPGGKKFFWNADVVDDDALAEGRADLVIVEGEMDCLSVREAGYPFVVSVPDGAPPPRQGDFDPEEIDLDHDDKYRYILNDWDALSRVRRVVLACDSDAPGRELAEELVRRLGRPRCGFVSYPDGCKDFNEVLMKHGPAAVAEMIATAKPYPVSGVYTYSQLPVEPELTPVSTGFPMLDQYIKPFFPALMVVTGFAGSGKSTWVNQVAAQMAFKYRWRAAIASLEMRIKPFITDALANTYRHLGGTDDAEAWINDNFVFIAPEPNKDESNFDIDWLIEKAVTAVVRHGIRVFVIDPWNEVEHALGRRESLTEYTGRALRALKRFGREYECLVIVVAHPTKEGARKESNEITLYDVSDSAHFANKADFGVVVWREGLAGEKDTWSSIKVSKVRYQPVSGALGIVQLQYDPKTRIFMGGG